jgi:hypothetical protein
MVGLVGLEAWKRLFPANIFPPNGREPLDQVHHFGIMLQPVSQVAKKRRGIGTVTALRQMIIDPESAFPVTDKAGILKNFEMFGYGWLGQFQSGLDLTYAQRFLLKYFQDLDPVRIRQSFHHSNKISHGHPPNILFMRNIFNLR